MHKLILSIDDLTVETFVAYEGAHTQSTNPWGERNTKPCSVYQSYCAAECGTGESFEQLCESRLVGGC